MSIFVPQEGELNLCRSGKPLVQKWKKCSVEMMHKRNQSSMVVLQVKSRTLFSQQTVIWVPCRGVCSLAHAEAPDLRGGKIKEVIGTMRDTLIYFISLCLSSALTLFSCC